MKIKLPSISTLRERFLPDLALKQMNNIKDYFADDAFYIIADESTDSKSRKILNILMGSVSNPDKKIKLIKVVEIPAANMITVSETIHQTLIIFLGIEYKKQRFALLISDQAPYMVAAGKRLKEKYNLMLHITCICHSLHLVAELLRSIHSNVNLFITGFKDLLHKNNKLKRDFVEVTGIEIYKWPVLTRWGTWLSFVFWIAENYEKISLFIEKKQK